MLLAKDGYNKRSWEWEKFGKRAYITPQLYSNSMTHFVTRLNNYCWFSKKPHITCLTVAEAMEKHPNYILWCFDNLHIRWSIKTHRQILKLKESRSVNRATLDDILDLFNY